MRPTFWNESPPLKPTGLISCRGATGALNSHLNIQHESQIPGWSDFFNNKKTSAFDEAHELKGSSLLFVHQVSCKHHGLQIDAGGSTLHAHTGICKGDCIYSRLTLKFNQHFEKGLRILDVLQRKTRERCKKRWNLWNISVIMVGQSDFDTSSWCLNIVTETDGYPTNHSLMILRARSC